MKISAPVGNSSMHDVTCSITMKWPSFLIPFILFPLIPVAVPTPDLETRCNALLTTVSRDFLYSYDLDHEGCTLRCLILFPSNPQKYKEYLDSSKVKHHFFNNIPCGPGRVSTSSFEFASNCPIFIHSNIRFVSAEPVNRTQDYSQQPHLNHSK